MTYASIAAITQSNSLFQRLTACAAQQKREKPYPTWVSDRIWDIAVSPGWADKWASAIAAGIENPGADESVISDADILAVIQPML